MRLHPKTHSRSVRIGTRRGLAALTVPQPSGKSHATVRPLTLRVRAAPAHDKTAKLALEDGTVFTGVAFGADGEVDGEVCFNTSMTGYQEILTDPSYRGQIVTMTYPRSATTASTPRTSKAAARIWRASSSTNSAERPSNFRSEESLDDYLKRHGIVGLAGIDTRALVRRLRTAGR